MAEKCDCENQKSRKGQTLQKYLSTVVIYVLTLVILFLLITIIFLLQYFQNTVGVGLVTGLNSSLCPHEIKHQREIQKDPNGNLTLPGKLKLVSRFEWGAQPPVEASNPLQNPVPYVIIHHTATENCSSQAQCIFRVHFIQTFHIESRNWWDIGYNFLVGGDGEAYEGRGWKSEGAHTYGYNAKSIGIAFIGTFNSFKPSDRQIIACKQLIAKGVELGYIKKDYKLLAARQLKTTQSPGAALYEDMKGWNNWSKIP